MRQVSDLERRARLGGRHSLAEPGGDVSAVTAALVGLHSSDPATVYLSARARVTGFEVADMEAALYEHRSLVRVLGMRRTLWVVPAATVAAVHNSSTLKMIAAERMRTARMIEQAGIAEDGAAWHEMVIEKTLRALRAHDEPVAAMELREEVTELKEQFVNYRSDGSVLGHTGVSTRVLFGLAAEGLVVRARPRGTWISGQYRWTDTERWLGATADPIDPEDAQVEVLARWLRGFGPGTEDDIAWWTGWTRGDVRRALARLGVVEVATGAGVGYLLPEDLELVEPPEPWVALLPSLDPTTMGWRHRGWYLGEHGPRLFDRNGNAGPTIWWDGRIVGGWGQRPDGSVAHRLLEDVGSEADARVEVEVAGLESWLGGVVVTPRFRTPLNLALAAPSGN